jgi:group II intron reverse transcriptase/maturase
VNRNKWVVDVDLKSYFDTIPHVPLMKLVGRRVGDKKILHIIRQWLKAGIMEEGKLIIPDQGTPQGGVLSPLLSNIYLHEIDKLWQDNVTVQLVRFADDMVFLCKSEKQAHWVLGKLKSQLSTLGLTLNMEKTKVRHVGEGFDFLGLTYTEAWSRNKNRKVRGKFPKSKSMKSIRDRIKKALRDTELGTTLEDTIGMVNRKFRGWAQYYRIGNSYKAAVGLSNYACRQLRLYWRRCKHRKDVQGTRKWKNSFFYEKGLFYAPSLLRGGTNASV